MFIPKKARPFTHVLFSALAPLLILCSPATSHAWELVKNKHNIKVYTQDSRYKDFKMFRASASLDTSLDSALDYLTKAEHAMDWLHDCIESQILKTHSPDHYVVYQVTHAPWPVQNRDYVLDIKIERARDGLSADITVTGLDNTQMKPKRKKHVRVTELQGKWRLTQLNNNTTEISYQTEANPTGKVPAWLANAFVVDQPYNTLLNLKRHFAQR